MKYKDNKICESFENTYLFQVTIRCWMHMRITSMIYSCQKMSINKDEWNRTTSRGVANLYITNCYTNVPLYKCKPKKLIYTNSLKSDKKKKKPKSPLIWSRFPIIRHQTPVLQDRKTKRVSNQILMTVPNPAKDLPLKGGGTWTTSYPLPSISLVRIRTHGRQSLWRDRLDLGFCRQVIPERMPRYRCTNKKKLINMTFSRRGRQIS